MPRSKLRRVNSIPGSPRHWRRNRGRFWLAVVNLAAGLERREWPLHRCAEFLHVAIDRYASLIDGWALVTSPGRVGNNGASGGGNRQAFRDRVAFGARLPRLSWSFLRFARFLATPDTWRLPTRLQPSALRWST